MMKKINALLYTPLLALILTLQVSAQDFHVRTGFGYYDPRIGGSTGNIFYTDVSYKLPTEFYVGVGFGFSDVFTTYGEEVPLFEKFTSIHSYYHFRLLINREFGLGQKGRHVLMAGTGLTYIQLRYAEPFVLINPSANELIVGISESDRNQDDAGILFGVDYGYKVHEKIRIGVHAEAHFLIEVGLGGLILAPQISFSF